MSAVTYPLVNTHKINLKKRGQSTAREAVLSLTPPIKSQPLLSSIPLSEACSDDFEIKDYQEIISKASIENELVDHGYTLLNRIIVSNDSGNRTQYVKTTNNRGQIVFIFIDVEGYTTIRNTDLTLAHCDRNSISHSVKSGACDCAGNDVFGVALESGSDTLCVLSRDEDLKMKESTFSFSQKNNESPRNDIISYPVIRLSEIRASPELVLETTDKVTRRLRNTIYASLLQELIEEQQSVERLCDTMKYFNKLKDDISSKLNKTLTQLEEWNKIYTATPPVTDEGKDRYKKLQYNLTQRNSGITTLIQGMKKVVEQKKDIDRLATQIKEVNHIFEKDFENIEYVLTE